MDYETKPNIIIKATTENISKLPKYWYAIQLFNNIMPHLSIFNYIEQISNGFIIFCQDFSAFMQLLDVSRHRNIQELMMSEPEEDLEDTISWDIEIIEFKSGKMINMFETLGDFWKDYGGTIISNVRNPKRMKLVFPSEKQLGEALNILIENLKAIKIPDFISKYQF